MVQPINPWPEKNNPFQSPDHQRFMDLPVPLNPGPDRDKYMQAARLVFFQNIESTLSTVQGPDFEIARRFSVMPGGGLDPAGQYSGQSVYMMRRDIKDQETFTKMQQDCTLSRNAPWVEGGGRYIVDAYALEKHGQTSAHGRGRTNTTAMAPHLDPYLYTTAKDDKDLKRKLGQFDPQWFGLDRDVSKQIVQPQVGGAQLTPAAPYPATGLSSIFGGLLGGNTPSRPQQQPQQQPGQPGQRQPNCEGPGLLDGVVQTGRGGVNLNPLQILGNAAKAATRTKPPGCE